MSEAKASILVIDDDTTFRRLVVDLLETKRYRVVEARSAEEANTVIAPKDIALAIVDYRLVGTDGMTWISKMREAGRNMPVIFISGSACDQKTFNWLRNILKVVLIVKKPIIPSVFLQQVESILPSNIKELVIQDNELELAAIAGDIGDEDDEYSATNSAGLLNQLMQIRTKLEVKMAMKVAQAHYHQELQDNWHNLHRLLQALKAKPTELQLLSDADHIAHKLKGTAGSLGLPQVSELAEKIEEFLRLIEPHESTDQEIIWAELFRILATGEAIVSSAKDNLEDLIKTGSATKSRVLLVTGDHELGQRALSALSITVDVAGSIAGARTKINRTTYDAAIIDPDVAAKETVLELYRELRQCANDSLPLLLISSGNSVFTEPELIYSGVSEVLQKPVDATTLEKACGALLSERKSERPRILIVDDDKVLSGFVSTVLEAHGIETRSLDNPILALDVLDEYKPDLMLLDVIMPGMTGYEVCRLVRESGTWEKLPILFLTGKTTTAARSAAFQAGATDFLTKPVLAEELLTRVNGHLSGVVRQSARMAKDDVTGLFREHVFFTRAMSTFESFDPKQGPLALCLLTPDEIETVRIVQGVDAVRSILIHISNLLLRHFKAEDIRGQLGSEGFAMIVKGHPQLAVAQALNLMLDSFSNESFTGMHTDFKTTFSAGVADTIEDGQTFYELLNLAHQRLLAARKERTGVIALSM